MIHCVVSSQAGDSAVMLGSGSGLWVELMLVWFGVYADAVAVMGEGAEGIDIEA